MNTVEYGKAIGFYLSAILALAVCQSGCSDSNTNKTSSKSKASGSAHQPFAGESYALLVGCTTYDNLGPESSLRGPVNDVSLMRDMLIKRFGFSDGNIRTLTEDPAAHARPLKNNIIKELRDLEQKLNSGDRVVLLLSGHGSQQPNDDPDDRDDPEPDGLDEIFCPADIDISDDPGSPFAINALTDDELRISIKAIRKHGAFVWVIVDSCHSGSAVRGMEVYRQISPERLVGSEAISKARAKVKVGTRGISRDDSVMDAASPEEGGLIAIYAAQPNEPTLEMMLPDESEDSQWRGLLTYTLIEIITSAQSQLTYRELVQRIHNEYIMAYGRLGPTPLIEGLDQQLQVLGQADSPTRTSLVLTGSDLHSRPHAGRVIHARP